MLTAFTSLCVIALAVYLLSVITDAFFIESLDVISEKLNLPPSVAGASLMAMGSSAPELAIAIFALFGSGGAHADIGIGTIVGSAVFNILVITGVSAMVREAHVAARVMVRDSLVYALAIGLLLLAFRDGRIEVWEAVAFVALYVVYLIILLFWREKAPHAPNELEGVEGSPSPDVVEEVPENKSGGGVASAINGITTKTIGAFTGDPRKHYLRAFIVSILLIAGICYGLVEATVAFATALSIPPVIVALTLLAAGTSVPDMISSMVVAKQGRGDMAIANAVGSNIFDILVGLGVPWLIAMLALGKQVVVNTQGLYTSIIILLGTVFILFAFTVSGQKLTRKEGGILVLLYGAYCVFVLTSGS